ncbi:putative S1-like domain-containing protein [Poronia punctata]|nr:putative S1-like domain-containing protein [Poronia punctata]
MGRPKRDVRAAAEASTTPPNELTSSQHVAKVIKAEGNSLYSCTLPNQKTVLVELASRFRNTIWIKRGGYVLLELALPGQQTGKVEGEIVNVVRDEKEWRKQSYWPKEFAKSTYDSEDDEDDSNVGKLPPSDSEDED